MKHLLTASLSPLVSTTQFSAELFSNSCAHVSFSFFKSRKKKKQKPHLWISQLPLSMSKTKRRKEDHTDATDGQVPIACDGWHQPSLTFHGAECQRFDRMLTEPSIDVTHQKALTRPLEISGIYVFLFLYLEGRKIREPSPCGLSTGREEERSSWSVWVIWAEVFAGLAFQRQNRNAPCVPLNVHGRMWSRVCAGSF